MAFTIRIYADFIRLMKFQNIDNGNLLFSSHFFTSLCFYFLPHPPPPPVFFSFLFFLPSTSPSFSLLFFRSSLTPLSPPHTTTLADLMSTYFFFFKFPQKPSFRFAFKNNFFFPHGNFRTELVILKAYFLFYDFLFWSFFFLFFFFFLWLLPILFLCFLNQFSVVTFSSEFRERTWFNN